jgi:ATP-dependent DNA helicase RecG
VLWTPRRFDRRGGPEAPRARRLFGPDSTALPAAPADLNTDTRVLNEARDAAALLSADPDLSRPEHRPLLEKVRRLFEENPDMFN